VGDGHRLRILYASFGYLPLIGGGELQLHGVARRLRARGHAPRVVCQRARPVDDWIDDATVAADPGGESEVDGVPVVRLGPSGARRRALAPWVALYRTYGRASPFASRRIAGLLAPDLARAAGAPQIVHAVRMGQEFLARAALAFARARGLPFVLTRLRHPPGPNPLHRAYDELARAADAVVAMTDAERDVLADECGVDPARIHVFGVGPVLSDAGDVDAFRARHGIAGPYVLFLGRRVRHKGAHALLAAARHVWERHPEVRFVFAGPPTPEFDRLRAETGDPRVLDLGVVDEADKAAALAGCELLCVPSVEESFGAVYVEAWSFAKPVVAARTPVVASVVEDGRTGWLAAPEPGALAERIGWLLDHPARARELGEAGRREVDRRWSWKRLVDRTEALYRSLV
jgi:glycosyltransferase involved in cell wall biosynthesis